MAESYRTEDEQIEELKKWWRENGRSVLLGIALAVGAVFGWQYWQDQRETRNSTASATFQNLVAAATELEQGEPTPEQLATARYLANTLKEDFQGTGYDQAAALYNAKFAVDAGDLEAAAEELKWVLAQEPEPELRRQAVLRLARVQYASGDYEQAVATLDGLDPGTYASAWAELRGDIRLAQGEREQALAEYRRASELAAELEFPINDPLLRMKLQDLQTAVEAQ